MTWRKEIEVTNDERVDKRIFVPPKHAKETYVPLSFPTRERMQTNPV